MKVDRGRNKKPTSALPPACQELIKKLLSATDEELAAELKKVESWSFGKCELYHWIGVLDRVDTVLASGTAYPDGTNENDQKKILSLCPHLQDPNVKDRVMTVVRFTALLIEHSYARHVYNSVEHLLTLMNCSDMDVVLHVLNVFYVFGKRSNFLSRLYARLKSNLSTGLEHLGKTWGGRENGFGLAESCKYKDLKHFPATATSVVFEYSLQEDSNSETMTAPSRQLQLKNVHEIPGTLEEIFTQLVETYHIPKHQQLPLLFKLRTARYFGDYQLRLKCIEARLQSIAIGISGSVHSAYSLSPSESLETFLYPGLIDEIVEVLELPDPHLMDIKAAALRALTAVVHLEKNPKLNEIVECTGTYAYHGFLPNLVREVITSVTGPGEVKFSQSFATALFSFLYHLSSYQYSAESLVSSGTVEALLQVVSWKATEPSGITFVTRAVRVLDLITNIDVSAFHGQEGWQKLLDRLEYEVEQCSLDVPGTLPTEVVGTEGMPHQAAMEPPAEQQAEAMEVSEGPLGEDGTACATDGGAGEKAATERRGAIQCIPQRSALIKSILNFFRKIVPDTTFADDVRSLHHSVLPNALKHIFSNGEYYGATLYLAAIDLFTSIVYHEPVMLSNLLDRGLPGVILNSFIMKDLPQTSEVLCAVPNCISALCLNEVIRRTIVSTQPFDRLLKTLISPEYHLTMKKHNRGDRSTVPNTIGVCVDQLLRHQTELRECFMDALLRLLDNTIQLGMGPEPSKEKAEHASRVMDSQEDDEEVEEVSGVFLGSGMGDVFGLEKEEELAALNAPPPQVESVINVVLFLSSVLCHNRSSDHAELFLAKGGIDKLYRLAALPNFPIDFPTMSSSTTLASIYGSILSITSNVNVVTVGLTQFGEVLDQLSQQLQPVLGQLQETVDLPAAVQVVNSGTLLHTISHTHCYLVIFNSLARIMHTSRFTNQPVPRHVHTLQVQAWSKTCGTAVLQKLAFLYRDLIWANFHLMAILDVEKVKYPPPPPPPETAPSAMETGGKEESSSSGTATVDSGIVKGKDGAEEMETGSSDEPGKGEHAKPGGEESKAGGEESKAEGEERKTEGEEGKTEGKDDKPEGEEGKTEGTEGKDEKPEGEEGKTEGKDDKPEGEEGMTEGKDDKPEGEEGKAEGEKEAAQDKEAKDGGKADSSSSSSSESEDEFGEKKKKRKKPDTEEIKILRGGNNFLTLSSRISRAMSELFNQLVLLIGEPPPKSRGQTVRPPMVLTPEIVLLSKLIVKIIVQFLREELPVISKGFIPTEEDQSATLFGHLAVNMYFLELCELLLFDDNRSAFHVLLKYFEEEGGIEILKEGYEHGMKSLLKCPQEGPIEGVVLDYFEMWLCFMEKIFSYDGTVRGAHGIPEPKEDNGSDGAEKIERLEFHPVHFFMKAQRILGPCVVELWKSPYLAHFKPRNTDLLLSVVRLLVESTENIEAGLKKWEAKEKEAKEKEAKKKAEEAAQQAAALEPPPPQLNPAHVQRLMGMSFTRDQAEEALRKWDNVEQAMEWLLNKPNDGSAAPPLSEDDQLSLAIALSLEQAAMAKGKDPLEQMDVNPNAPPPFSDDAMIHEIATDIIPRWKVFVFEIPDTVFRVSSLMCSLCERMGNEYMCKLHEQLMAEVLLPESEAFIAYFEGLTEEEVYQKLRDPNFKNELDRFRIVMHLLAQYAKEEPLVTMQMAQMGGFDVIVKVLTTTLPGLTRINRVQNMHGWIAHLLVALDLCLKQFEFVKWKTPEDMKVQWLWFDENIGKWTPYSPEGTTSIEKAFLREDSSVKVTANRQKQTVALSHMLQVTGSISPDVAPSRPVIRMLLPPVDFKKVPCDIDGLTHKAAAEVTRVCTLLIPSALDKEGMHANFRLLVRFTRWEDLTQVFVDNQGIEKMFRARRRSGFKSYYSMACLIIRHIFEMGPMRRFVFERNFIKMANSPYFQFQKEVHPVGDQSKEFFYVMRRLSGAARRDYDMFCEMATRVFKLNGPFPEHSMYAGVEPVPPVQLTVMPPSEPIPTELSEAQQKVLKCMTDTIIKRDLPRLSSEYDRPKDLADDEQKVSRRIRIVSGWPTEKEREKAVAEDLEAEKKEPPKSRYDDSDSDTEYYRSKDKAQVELDIKNDAPELWRRYELPVLTKAALTRMMMELVECYPTILPYLCHCQKMVKMEKREPAEEMTFFSFLLDYLLAGDMRISSFMGSRLPKRLLESILTSEYVNSEVQEVFVHEFKQSVVKCLQLPECMMKHNRLRSLCSLLNYFMESRTSKPLHTITRLLIHKGIISDLAHSSYSLDLDNSSFSTTMNAILRPLDRLIRYVNQVNAQARQHRHAKQAEATPATSSSTFAAFSSVMVALGRRLAGASQEDSSQQQQQQQQVAAPAEGGAGSSQVGTREAETQQPASESQPSAVSHPVSSSTPVVEAQHGDEVHDSTMDAESQQTEEPLVPLEVHDDEVIHEEELSDLMGVMLEAQLGDEHLSEDSDEGSEEEMYQEEEGDVEGDNYNSAGEEKESDYDASHAEDAGHESEEAREQERVREVMISFRDELSSEHSGRENEGEAPFDDSADIDVGVEGDVESTGDDEEVEEEEMEDGMEAEELVDDPQEGDDSQEDDDSVRDVDSNDDDADDDSSLLDSDADDSWPRAREGSNSSSSSGGSRTQRFHQPDETGPIPLVHPLTIRRIVQVYSLATGRLVNQRSEHHSEGAEHIRYRRIALQAGIMRPTFNPTSSVSQLMAGGERQEKEKDSPNSGSLMMMEDYEMGPVHGAIQRWDEAVNAMDGLAKDLMIGHAMWEVGARLQEAYEQEQANKKTETSSEMEGAPEENKETSFPAVQPGRIELVSTFTRRYESRNIEEASSVATRGSSPTQSVMTMESERSLSPTHTTASGTAGEQRQQPASRESTPQSHEPREEAQEAHLPASPSQASTQQELPQVPLEVDGSRQAASVQLAQLEPGDPLHTFFSAVAGDPYPPIPPPSSRTAGNATSGASATGSGDLEQEESTSSSSPSDTLGPLLTSSLTVSSTNTLTTVSASGTQPIPTSNLEPKHEDEMEVEPRGAHEAAGGSSSEQGAVGPPAQGLLTTVQQSTDQVGTVAEGEASSGEGQGTVEGEQRGQAEPMEGEQRGQAEPMEGEQRGEGEPQEAGQPSGSVAVAGGSGREDASEEIDPTFLAALPLEIRQEVLAQHRSTRERHSAQHGAGEPSGAGTANAPAPSNIDQGVLAQLPPDIQAEVRQQQAGESSLSVTAADWTALFSSLVPSLRRSIISDLSEQDDATLGNPPEEIMADIRRARLDRERRRLIMEQLALHAPSAANLTLSAVLQGRPTPRTVRISTPKGSTTKQILDPEAITCLLVLLFMEQHRLHVHRMHRVVRQISQHPETRAWVMATIINIIEECHGVRENISGPLLPLPETVHHRDQWLNLTCAGALGSHSPVFSTERSLKGGSAHKVSVHPHACPIVCKNALELLVVMGKHFSSSFLPPKLIAHPKDPALPPPLATHQVTSNFWQILTRLNDGTSRKGKGSSKMSQYGREEPEDPKSMFSQSFIAHLIQFLEHPVISKNPVLTNKLLRMLVVISGAIPRTGLSIQTEEEEKEKEKEQQSAAAEGGTTAQGESSTGQGGSSTRQGESSTAQGESSTAQGESSTAQGESSTGQGESSTAQGESSTAQGESSTGQGGSSTAQGESSTAQGESSTAQGESSTAQGESSTGQGESSTGQGESSTAQGESSTAQGGSTTAQQSSENQVVPVAMDSSSGPSGVQVRDDVFEKEEESIVEPRLLRYIMKLLLCSASLTDSAEEDATKLLMNLSHSSPATRQAVMHLMIEAAKDVGRKVRAQIDKLLEELIANMDSLKKPHSARGVEREGGSSSSQSQWPPSSHPALRGVILPQGAGSKKKVDHTHDIHLPAMTPLTCKGSQQALFLRILKVVHDLRDAALIAAKGRLRRQGKVSRDFTMDHLLPRMSVQLEMEELWEQLSECLNALADTQDPHAVLVLQPAVEAFFIVHGVSGDYRKYKETEGSNSVSPHPLSSLSDDFAIPGSPLVHPTIQPPPTLDERSTRHMPPDLVKFLKFAEAHHTVLNSILRQMGTPLGESPFAILVEHSKLLDFDIKRRYFRQELDAMTDGSRREDLVLHIRRSHLFADSFRELYHRNPYELQSNLYISFEGEEGQDAGGVQREWYLIISREIFNPGYAMFKTTPGGRTYVPNPSSHINPDHLQYFKFVGRVIAKAIADNKLLDCFFSRSFYKHIIGKPVQFSDLEAEDYTFYQSMRYLLEHDIDDLGLELTFSTEVTEFGETKTKDLIEAGHTIAVVEANKKDYVKHMCQLKMTDSIKPQLRNFLEGFYEVIPRDLISIFNEQELELMISGLPVIDLEDLRNNTEYHKYSPTDLQIQWFWRALKSFDETDRARFLQFVTGTSRVPLQGFSSLEGMSGPQKFQIHRDERSVGRLPSAHTCFNQLDLPVYSTYDELHKMLLLAIREGHEGFGFI